MNRQPSVLAALALLIPLAAAAAGAEPLRAGEGFQVGGVYVYVVSTAPDGGALFRVTERLEAGDAEEHADCYRVGRSYYHVESCPVLQAHFARSGAPADSPAPAASVSSGGSHPVDYLRGRYTEPDSGYGWAPGFYYGLGYGPAFDRDRFSRRRAFGPRGRHDRRSGHLLVNGATFRFSFRRW